MKPTECPNCHSAELADGRIGQFDGLFYMSLFKAVPLHAAACLECGVITPYVDSSALEKVRKWDVQASPKKAINDDL